VRTLQRWKAAHGLVALDGPPGAVHPTSTHALTPAEHKEILRVTNEPCHNLDRPGVVCRDYDRPSQNGVDRHREGEVTMDNRRQQFMLAFVTYMDLRQIEDEELRRKLIADMNRKLDELVAKGAAIPEITPERVAALGLEH
jgi:hypothetical protein